MAINEAQPQLQGKVKKARKPMKRWVKWLMFTGIGLILLIIAALGAGYWYIKSISLEDIKSRHPVAEQADGSTPEPAKIPAIMESTVDKAADLVGQDIEGQDALDVAAILLNSGLSLKDIRYLQGNASYDLSTEEKQRIRDLLLEKLTAEEIELLRSITGKYGKHLVILNPEYPIEWVGERDPELIKEHERLWNEMKAAKEAEAAKGGGQKPAQGTESKPPEGTDSDPAQGTEPNAPATPDKPNNTNKPTQPSGQLTDKQLAEKKKIDAKYDSKLASLKSTCTAKSNTLLQAILKDMAADPDISLVEIQSKFIGQLADAESSCDEQFNTLLAQAQAAYADAAIPAASMPDWKSDYSKAKSAARAAGIAAIAGKLNKE